MANSGFDKVRDMRGDNDIDVGDGGSRITTGRGDDTITAGDGYDKIKAGGGDNQISVGDGGSSISTRGGDDTITAGDGFDRISAGNGDNDINVGDGGSFIKTGRGDDLIVSEDGYDFIFAGDGNNEIDAGDGGSFIKSGSGDDTITTGEGYDKIFAGNGNNEINTGDGGSFVQTGSGDDTIETGDGWDFVHAGNGNNQVDIGDGGGMVLTGSGDDNVTIGDQGFAFVHTGSGDDRVTVQIDEYLCFAKLLGGNGVDTLVLDISLDTYKDDYFQAEMAYFLEHRAPDGRPFYFRSLNIYVHSFEQVEVVVDGVSLDPIDLDVVASDDAVILSEDDGAVLFGSVVDNDDVPNGLAQVTLIQGPAAGVLDLAPDGTFSFDPNDEFESLAEGEVAEVTFIYEISDLDGDTSQAVATISIIGDNDAPFLVAGTLDAAEDGPTVDIDLAALGGDVDSDDDGSTLTYSVTGNPSEGSASISGTTLTFDPGSDFQDLALGETRDVTVQVTAEDAHGATAVNTVTVTVTGGNDAPTLAAALASADEDGASVDVDLAALGADVDSDDDGSTLTYSVTGTPSEGSASISGTTLTFDPGSDFQDLALGETRDVTIQVTAEDAHGATAVNTVTVTVTGGNDAPTLAAALASADEDGASVDVDLAALGADVDSDDDGSTLTYSVTGTPSEGSASISGTTLTFDPGSDFQDLALGETRDVTIQVTAEDAHGATAVNTVTVTVTGGNDAPTLAAALASANEDGATVDVDLAALGADVDSDDDGSTLTYSVTGNPSEGSASISGTTLTFDPGSDFQDLALGETRDVTIQITAEDAHGATAVNTVTVTVTGTNDAPVAQAISGEVAEEDSSAEAFSLGIADSSTVPNAGLFYVLDYENQSLTEVFRAVGTIDTPLQAAQSLNVTNGMVLSLNGNNADWGAVAASIVDGVDTWADPNLFELSGYTGSMVADPLGFVLYRDSVSNATLTISVPDVETPDGPTTYEISAEIVSFQDNRVGNIDVGAVQFTSVPQPAPDTVIVSADFSDVDTTDTHSFSVDTTGTQGEVTNNGDGTFTYSANGAFDGLAAGETTTDTFTYTVTDDSGAANDSATETATITITGINDVPTLAEGSVAANEDGGAVNFDLSSIGDDIDSDDDGSTLSYTITGQPGEGSASISGATLTFDPGSEFQDLSEGETRDVVIQITAEDAQGATAVNDVTVTVTGVNDAPTLADTLANANEDGATVDIDLAALGGDVDSDDDGSTLTYSVTGNPSEGSASISGTTLTFDPSSDFQDLALGETRDVTIQVTAEDAHGATAVNTVTVTVTGGNDAPTLAAALASADEDGASVDVDLAALGADVDSDDDGSTLTYSVTGTPSEGSASISGTTLTFDPGSDFQDLALGETRDVTIQVTAEDAHGATAVNTVTVTVTGGNDAPTLAAALASANEDGATVDVDLAALGADVDSDDDGSTLTYSVTGNQSEGSASISGTTLTFDPGSDFQDLALGETRDVTIQVTAEDAHGATAVNTVTVTVTGGNDAPTLAAALASANEDGATVDVDLAALGADADSDDDGSTLTYSVTGNPSEGSAIISGTTLTFDPGSDFQDLALGETRDVTIQVTAEDAHGATAVNTVAVTVTGTNDAPVAQAVSGAVNENGAGAQAFSADIADSSTVPNAGLFYVLDYENQTLNEVFRIPGVIDTNLQAAQSIGVSDGMVLSLNGNSADWGAAAASIVNGVETLANPSLFDLDGYSGTVVVDPRGWVSYKDDVTNATLTITVSDVQTPDGPTTYEISAQIVEFDDNNVGNIDVGAVQFTSVPQPAPDVVTLSVDFDDVDLTDTHSYSIETTGTQGSVTDNGDGTFEYSTNGAFEGLAAGETATDSFTYTVDDGNGGTSTETATITITGQNDAPVASAIAASVDENGAGATGFDAVDGAYVIPNLGRWWIADYDAGTLTSVARATGTLQFEDVAPTNGVVLTLNPNAPSGINWGAAAMSYSDGVGTFVDPALIQVEGFAGTPVVVGDSLNVDGTITNGTVRLSVADVQTPDGPATFDFTVNGVDNPAPGAASDTLHVDSVELSVTPQVVSGTVDVTASFTDVDVSDTHSFTVDSSATTGAVTNNGDGTFTYDTNGAFEHLAEGETATDSFTYTVDDGNGGTSTETATITITGQNDAPAAATIDAGTVDEDGGSQTIDLLANATDIDGDNLSVSGISVVDDMGVALSFTDNGDGTIAIDPIQYGEDLGQGESRVVTVSYDIEDGTTTVSNTATMTVNGITNNIAPTAQDTAVTPGGAGYVFDETPVVTSQQVSVTDNYQSGQYQYDANNDSNATVIAMGDGGYAVAWREVDGEYSGSTRQSQTDQIAVQLYGADDAPVGAKMTFGEVDTSYSNDTDVDRSNDYNPRMISLADGGFALTWEGSYRAYSGTTQVRYERDVYVQVFDASGAPTSTDPIKVSQTVPAINGNTSAFDAFQDYQAEVAALADGGLAISWRGVHYDVSGTTLNSRSYEQNVYVRAFDIDGTARGAEVSLGSVDTSRSGDDRDRHTDYSPRVAASDDGSFAVVWQGSYSNYSGTTYTGNSTDIYMQLFDADGVAQGAIVQVSQTVEYQSGSRTQDAHSDTTPEIAALANGGYVVTWQGQHAEYNGSTFVSSEDNIWARVYNADGQPVSGEISLGEVDQSYGSDNRDRAYDNSAKVVATSDGGFVVTWSGSYYAYNGTTAIEYTQDVYIQRFDENGDALSAAQQISQTGQRTTGNYQVYDSISDSDPQITDLLGGGFVVSWYSDQQTYNGSVRVETARVVQAQRFGEDGVAVGDVITLGTIAQDQNGYDQSGDSQARVTALNDGGFAIAWQNYTNKYDANGNYQGNSSDVFVAAVHASGGGTALTDPVDVDVADLIDDADLSDGDQLTVTVATGSNGSTATVNGTVISVLPNAAYYAALGKDETEDETFTYTVTDLAGAQATATITLTVTGNNDKPEANAISGATDEDGPATTLTADFTDVDTNDIHTYSVNTADTLGVVTNNGDGTFDYDPNGAFEALAVGETTTDTFKYTVRDAAGKSSTATATVTITGENDAPTAQAAAISNGYVFAETPETNQQQVSLTDQYQSGSQTRDANYDDQARVINFGDGGYAVAWHQRDETYSGSTRIDSEDQVAVQIYDADHNKVGGIQTFGEVDQSYSRDNLDRSYDNQISMTELDTGGFAISWYGNYRSYSGTTLTRYERDIYVQIFDENGAPTSTDPIKVSETAFGTNGSNPNYDIFGDFEPAITSLADGGIAVTWRADEYGLSGTTLNTSIRDNQIKVQAFDTDGTARGSIVELGSIDRSYSRDSIDRHYEYEPRIAASDDGGFVVVWRGNYNDYSGTTTVGRQEDVFIQAFDSDGTTVGATTQVSQTVDYTSGSFTGDAYRDYEPEVTALANGNYAVTWRGDHATYSGSTITSSEQNIYVRVFDSSGQPVSQEVSVGSVGTSYSADDRDRHYDYNPEITATEDGGFVVAWYGDYYTYSGTTQTSYERDIWVQRFDKDGAALGDEEKVSQTVPRQSGSSDYDSFQDYSPVITGLEGGGYVVVWESNQETYNGTTFVSSERLIQAQRFDVEGKKAGDVIDLGTVAQDSNDRDQSTESQPKVAALEGGGFAVTWQNYTNIYSSSGSYIGNEQNVFVAAIQPIGNGSLADGVVVDVADKIDDIDLAGGDSLTVSVDAVGSNGSTATVVGTEITISPNLAHYTPLAKGETAEETFTYTVTDASGAQASATLTFTARGENDAPVVDSVTYSTLDSGTIAFSDVDSGDTHTVSATDAAITGDASALAGIDVFDFISFDAVDQAADTVDWTINVPSSAQSAVAAALADGETLTIDYTVGVSDEEEDVAQATVSITLDGDGFLI